MRFSLEIALPRTVFLLRTCLNLLGKIVKKKCVKTERTTREGRGQNKIMTYLYTAFRLLVSAFLLCQLSRSSSSSMRLGERVQMSVHLLPLSLHDSGVWKNLQVGLDVDVFSSIVIQCTRDDLLELAPYDRGGLGLSVAIGGVISFQKAVFVWEANHSATAAIAATASVTELLTEDHAVHAAAHAATTTDELTKAQAAIAAAHAAVTTDELTEAHGRYFNNASLSICILRCFVTNSHAFASSCARACLHLLSHCLALLRLQSCS